jgi:hypothetical protein
MPAHPRDGDGRDHSGPRPSAARVSTSAGQRIASAGISIAHCLRDLPAAEHLDAAFAASVTVF